MRRDPDHGRAGHGVRHGLFGSGADYLDDNFLQSVANDFCFVIVAGDFIGLTNRQIQVDGAERERSQSRRRHQREASSSRSSTSWRSSRSSAARWRRRPEFQFGGHSVIDPTRSTTSVDRWAGSWAAPSWHTTRTSCAAASASRAGPGRCCSSARPPGPRCRAAPSGRTPTIRTTSSSSRCSAAARAGRSDHDRGPRPGRSAARHADQAARSVRGDRRLPVTNLSTEMVARTMKIKVMGPSLKSPWGLEVTTEPQTSALTIYDEHRTPLPPTNNAAVGRQRHPLERQRAAGGAPPGPCVLARRHDHEHVQGGQCRGALRLRHRRVRLTRGG